MEIFTDHLAVWLYFIPLAVCTYTYVMRSIREVQYDLANRDAKGVYIPRATVGTICGRILITVLPGVNAAAAYLILIPQYLYDCIVWLRGALDYPLVKPRSKKL